MVRQKTLAAIELSENKWNLAIASLNVNSNQLRLEHVGTYFDKNKLKEILRKFNISNMIYCITNQYSSTFITNLLSGSLTQIEGEKTSRGINSENCDYMNFGNSSILVELPDENIPEIDKFHKELDLGTVSFLINQSDVVLSYNVVRNYPDQFRLTLAIANFTDTHIGLSVYQNGNAKQVVWCDITNDTPVIDQVVKLLTTCLGSCEQPRSNPEGIQLLGNYDVLFCAGECSLELATQIKNLAAQQHVKISEIELLDTLRSPLLDIQNLPVNQRERLEHEPYRYATAISALTMPAEGLGLDLTLTHKLDKQIPLFPEIKIESDRLTKLATTISSYTQNITPALTNQKFILVIAGILAVILVGYRVYSTTSRANELARDYSVEQVKEQTLSIEKRKYEELEKRNRLKNERVAAIRNIQKTQMLVPTILGDIQNLLFQPQFRDLVTVSQLKINNSEVTLKGHSIDKINATAFVTRLQNSNYEDVIPTRYTGIDSVRCSYELTTKYNGTIPSNPITLPSPSQIQLKQITLGETEHSSTSLTSNMTNTNSTNAINTK